MPVQTRSQKKAQTNINIEANLQTNRLHDDLMSLIPTHACLHSRDIERIYHKHSFLNHLGDVFKNMYMSIQCATKPIPLVHSKWVLMSLNDVVQHFITKKNKNQ